jgi:hypothetical protein
MKYCEGCIYAEALDARILNRIQEYKGAALVADSNVETLQIGTESVAVSQILLDEADLVNSLSAGFVERADAIAANCSDNPCTIALAAIKAVTIPGLQRRFIDPATRKPAI